MCTLLCVCARPAAAPTLSPGRRARGVAPHARNRVRLFSFFCVFFCFFFLGGGGSDPLPGQLLSFQSVVQVLPLGLLDTPPTGFPPVPPASAPPAWPLPLCLPNAKAEPSYSHSIYPCADDQPSAAQMVKYWAAKAGMSKKPMYMFGVSSGASFAIKFPGTMKIQGVVSGELPEPAPLRQGAVGATGLRPWACWEGRALEAFPLVPSRGSPSCALQGQHTKARMPRMPFVGHF